ncbi:MAG: hypothetical protein ACRBFS_18065 [Aureispira sp.]
MKALENFLALFSTEERSTTIELLAQQFFIKKLWLAAGVQLTSGRKGELKYFLLDKQKRQQYEAQFLVFAQATNSGCAYAFYKAPTTNNCDEWPILVLGDQGGTVLLAQNIFELMQFWTLNTIQPYVNSINCESFDFSIDSSDYETLEYLKNNPVIKDNEAYKNWIQTTFGLAPLANLEAAQKTIIEPASARYQQEIDAIFYD